MWLIEGGQEKRKQEASEEALIKVTDEQPDEEVHSAGLERSQV